MKIWFKIHAECAIAVLLLALCGANVQSQDYSIDWHKIAGGGWSSSNGQYSICGTIGQPDAGAAMTRGAYSLTGGFWSIIALVQTPGAPTLIITHSGNSVTVSWPISSAGFVLQTNNAIGTANWINYGGSVTGNSVTISPPSGNLFFRLNSNP